MIAALTVLGVALLGVGSGDGGETGEVEPNPDGSAPANEITFGKSGDPAAPGDMSFLCDGFSLGEYVNLEAGDRDEVEEKVEEFVLTAYGDPGTDPATYEKAVGEIVVEECFWKSLAAGYVNNMEEVARNGGKANAPSGAYDSSPTFAREMAHFEVEYANKVGGQDGGAGFTTAVGTAVWVSEESNGEPRAWQQSIKAARSDAGGEWEILSGQTIPPYIDTEYRHRLPDDVD